MPLPRCNHGDLSSPRTRDGVLHTHSNRIGLVVSLRFFSPRGGVSRHAFLLDSINGTGLPFESYGLHGSHRS